MRAHLASLVEDFRRHGLKRGKQTAVVVYRGNRRYATSYAELATLTGRFSAELARRGIGPGQRVVLWGENSAEWIAAFFGCLLRGVIAVPLDVTGSTDFAARVMAEVSPRLIVGDRDLWEGDGLKPTSQGDPLRQAQGGSWGARLPFSEFQGALPAEPLFAVDAAVSEKSPLQIVFTSGTTSEPKGIVHTHRNVLASVGPIEHEMQKYLKYERWVHPLRFLHSLPLSHVFGQFMGLWMPALLAAEVHFESQLEPARLIATIHRERISVLAAVPRVLELLRAQLLTKYPGLGTELTAARGESVWRRWWRFRGVHRALGLKFWAIVCGGASLPGELEEFWNSLGFALIQGYGLTETAALVTLNHPFKIGRGTIGKPLPGREVRIGENGEILVRGEMLSTASWQAGQLRHRPTDEEWLNTGDMAVQDASGELRFLGRRSDVIVTASGMNIHAADLEAAVGKQPGVGGCAVVACAVGGPGDGAAATEPVAVAIFSGADDALHAAIRDANRELAEYQQIRHWLRWPEMSFPYTSTGKLLRRKVAEWACATLADRAISAPTGDGQDALLNLIASIAGPVPVNAGEASLLSEDLRLDSLGRVQLQSALEQRLGIDLLDNAIEQVTTLGELRALLGAAVAGNGLAGRDEVDAGEKKPQVDSTHAETLAHDDKFIVSDGMPIQESPTSQRQNVRHQDSFLKGLLRAADEHLYPHWPWWTPVQFLRVVFIEAVMRPLVWLLAAPRLARETAEIPDGPLLLIANHVSSYDAALVLYALPAKVRRRVAIAMSGEMLLNFRKARRSGEFRMRFFGPIAYFLLTALFNAFPLPRSSGFRRSFAHAGEALDRGYSVLIFPEGHRSKDGRLQPFRPGIGLLAQQSRVPILPMALKGMGELKQSGGRWFRSGRLSIHVGLVVPFDQKAEAGELTHRLEVEVGRL